jgi:hypothetical protein
VKERIEKAYEIFKDGLKETLECGSIILSREQVDKVATYLVVNAIGRIEDEYSYNGLHVVCSDILSDDDFSVEPSKYQAERERMEEEAKDAYLESIL